MDMKLIDNWRTEIRRLWSLRVAAFWGAVGGLIVVLGAFLNFSFNWGVGVLLILISATFAAARLAKQPGTEQ